MEISFLSLIFLQHIQTAVENKDVAVEVLFSGNKGGIVLMPKLLIEY